jgi:large subunit ribosomal protein L44e
MGYNASSIMKFPKGVNRYCPMCKARHKHKVSEARTKPKPKTKKHGLKWGVRQFFKVTTGYGGMPRSKLNKSKQSKHIVLKYTCEKCKKAHVRSFARQKKFSQV